VPRELMSERPGGPEKLHHSLAVDKELKFCFAGGNSLVMWPIEKNAHRTPPAQVAAARTRSSHAELRAAQPWYSPSSRRRPCRWST
jgi:hypothetical protein